MQHASVPTATVGEARDLAASCASAWILGSPVGSDDTPQNVSNPSTGEALLEFKSARPEDVTQSLRELMGPAQKWAASGIGARIRAIKTFRAAIEEEAELIAVTDTLDAGLPIATTRADLLQALALIDAMIGWSLCANGSVFPANGPGPRAMTMRQPFGVVGVIVPYNHPAKFALSKTIPALLAGNVVVLKPSDETPLSAMIIGSIAARTLPPGVFNVVPGGPEVGQALTGAPEIARVSFTGSTEVGIKVATTMAKRLGTAHLELGGKNATVILSDAHVSDAASAAFTGMDFTRSAGQACWSLSRIFVSEEIADEFLEQITAKVNHVKPGDPLDNNCEMGPLSTRAGVVKFDQFDKISSDASIAERRTSNGHAPKTGLYRNPVVAEVYNADSRLMTEEIFGPLLSVHRIPLDADVESLVNDSAYGLSASIWTRDVGHALDLAERVDAGYVWVNAEPVKPVGVPFGAWKLSGYGKGGTPSELDEWTREKSVIYNIS